MSHMGGGPRRSVRRTCFAAAGACCVLFVALPALAQEEGTPPAADAPAIWRGAASSLVASVEADREALLPVADVLRFIALQGESVYETDRQTARASLFFPGEGVIQGPNLACGTFGGMFPAEFKPILEACTKIDYPLTVRADASAPDMSTAGAVHLGKPTDAVSAEGIGAKAHADVNGSSTDATIEDLKVLGLPGIDVISLLPLEQLQLDASVIGIGSATSRTDQRITDGKLVVQATSTMSGVDLVGGLIHIGSIHSSSAISDGAGGARTADASLDVSGVTVAGLPAQITADGIVIGSPAGDLGPIKQQLQSALQQLLSALNVKITLLGTTETKDDGTGQAVASAGGLLLELGINVQGAPTVPGPLGDIDLSGTYVGSVQLGYTGASGAASNFPSGTVPPDTTISGDTGGTDGSFTFDPGTPAFDLGSPELPSNPPAVTPPRGRHLVRSLGDGFGDRLGLLYLAFAFAVLGLCILPRLSLPSRLPGSRS